MVQAQRSSNSHEDEAPAWAPLRDNYMLTNPKLKDWDKKQVSFVLGTSFIPMIYTLLPESWNWMSAGNKRGRWFCQFVRRWKLWRLKTWLLVKEQTLTVLYHAAFVRFIWFLFFVVSAKGSWKQDDINRKKFWFLWKNTLLSIINQYTRKSNGWIHRWLFRNIHSSSCLGYNRRKF